MNKYSANQDIREYMEDHGVSQRALASAAGMSTTAINLALKTELCQKDKERYLKIIDSIVAKNLGNDQPVEEPETCSTADACGTKFQIGDRVKIPAKAETIGVVTDIWSSMVQYRTMYEVTYESNGHKGMYAENQLEPAPIPIEFSLEAHIDGNVAVVTMNATQGEKTWIYARGHAHILHDGEVGMAQAISFAARRMFESLDSKQENKIYVRGGN